jgi:hypothetical protein
LVGKAAIDARDGRQAQSEQRLAFAVPPIALQRLKRSGRECFDHGDAMRRSA